MDPVRSNRATIARYTRVAQRTGYALFLLALVLFVVGLVVEFTGTVANATIACVIVGSVVLAPAIVLGYAVKAAEREDRERGL